MEKLNKSKLPESITLEEEYRKARASWMWVLNSAQNAYDSLRTDPDVGNSLPELEDLTEDWIKGFVGQKIGEVMQTPVPNVAKQETIKQWRDLENDICTKIKKIKALNNLDPKINVEVKGCHIIVTNMDELLREREKFIVPQSYKDYFEKIVNVSNALSELREYERTNNLDRIDYPSIPSMANPDNFIKWRMLEAKLDKYRIR